MVATPIPARDLTVQVEDAVPDTWLDIAGINSTAIDPSQNAEEADRTTYDSNGQYEGVIMQRGATLEVSGLRMKDTTTGAVDPGQARVDALAAQVADASLGRIRFAYTVDAEWKVWTATVTPGSRSGNPNADRTWGATFRRSGPSTTMAKV